MDSLPAELLRYFFPFLPLTSLIAARGVNTKWRSPAMTSALHPARKALLDVYLAAIVHPTFPSIVEALRPHLQEFNREAYITTLTSRGCVLPDVFEIWILEWPSKAVYFHAWPGLPGSFKVEHKNYCSWVNMLGVPRPKIAAIPVSNEETASMGRMYQGLALWAAELWVSGGVVRLWLVVDANESIRGDRAGKLVWTHSYCADEVDKLGPEHGMRILYNTPFVANTLIGFLSLLDVTHAGVEKVLLGYYTAGIN